MIRERRSKEKLEYYYQRFVRDGIIDPNVHPWVAAAWQQSRVANVPHDVMPPLTRLPSVVRLL